MNYYTVEFQSDGSSATIIPYAFTDEPHAKAKYHQIMSVACLSEVKKHGAIVFCDDTNATRPSIEVYEHGEHTDNCAWIVVEFQFNGESFGTFGFSFTNRNEAESKYHALLSVAAVSNVNRHGAICFADDGYIVGSTVYAQEAEGEE